MVVVMAAVHLQQWRRLNGNSNDCICSGGRGKGGG
jgi:hypothetical protein